MLYACDKAFQVDDLLAMTDPQEQFGVIIVTGENCTLAIAAGDNLRILSSFNVDIPKKHRNGGQSQNRFQRIRVEVRGHYLNDVSDECRRIFLNSSGLPIVTGIVIGGVAQLKDELAGGGFLAEALQRIVVGVVDINYGGVQGMQEAMKKCGPLLREVTAVRDQAVLQDLFDRIGRQEPAAIGKAEVLRALQEGAISSIFVIKTLCDRMEDGEALIDWLLGHHSESSAVLHLISDATDLGAQIAKGFGGVVGLLRYPIDFGDQHEAADDVFDSDFDELENIM